MVYLEVEPSAILSPFIDKYWIAQGRTGITQRFRILPDGHSDFIFCLGDTAPSNHGGRTFQPCRAFYVGAMTTFSELAPCPSGNADMLGVRFKPGGLAAFSHIPLHEYRNLRVDITEGDFPFRPDFSERLCETETTGERIGKIEAFLLSRLKKNRPFDPQTTFAINSITASHGQIPIRQLMNDICLCQRHFERKFKIHTGYTPKELCRIVRFRKTVDTIQSALPENFSHLAVDCGYYDHSHLLKDFHLLAGIAPSDFCSLPGKGPLAVEG